MLNRLPLLKWFQTRVGARILTGYLLVFILLGGVSAFALYRLYSINATFDALRQSLTQDQQLVQEILRDALEVRYYVHRYINTHQQQDRDNLEATYTRLQGLILQAWQGATDPSLREMLGRLIATTRRYEETFGSIASLIQHQQRIQSEVLDVQALTIEWHLSALRVALTATDDFTLFLYFNNAQNNFQNLRFNVGQYLLTGEEGYLVLADRAYEQAQAALEELIRRWPDEEQKSYALAATDALRLYYQGIQDIRSDYRALLQARANLDTLEPEILAALNEMNASVARTVDERSQSAESLVRQTRLLIAVAIGVASLLALVMNTALIRQITRPLGQVVRQARQIAEVDLRALTEQLRFLSCGNVQLSLEVTTEPLHIGRRDELGELAQAFNSIITSFHEAEQAFGAMAEYLQKMAAAATAVSQPKLDIEVPVYSEQDVLGLALQRMLVNLRAAYAQILRQIARLEALRAIDYAITSSRDLDQVMSLVAEQAVALLEVARFEILLECDGQMHRFGAGPLALPEETLQACTTWSMEQGAPHLCHDLQAEEHPLRDHLPPEVRAWYTWPLWIEGRLRGAVHAFHVAANAVSEEGLNFTANLIEQVRVAVEYIELVAQLERRVRERTAEVEAQKEEVKRFAYIVSHDLRAPLVNLMGFSDELRVSLNELTPFLEKLLPQLPADEQVRLRQVLEEDIPEALNFIVSSVSRMDRFIGALLTLSRLGWRELRLESVDMNGVVQHALNALSHQLKEKQVTVDLAPLPVIVADRTAMEQVIGNLLDNAVKYLVPGRPGHITITAEEKTDRFLFHIQDNGRGIAEGDMDKIFMPFRRVGSQDIPGDGMGLPCVQALVRRHGGETTCQSVLGEGSVFSFSIAKFHKE